MKIGVLALQGAFREHCDMLERCGTESIEVRKTEHLDDIQGLILPGGESTTIGILLEEWNLMDKVKERAAQGMAIYGTCAGMILLAKNIIGSKQPRLGLMDVVVLRNAYGRQRESFEIDLNVPELGEDPVRAVFVRAPYISSAESNVEVLATVNDQIVVARQGKILATAFHPEFTNDDRIHKYFIKIAQNLVS